MDPIRLSGGLWLCWNSNAVTLDIILKNDRMFHYVVYVLNKTLIVFLLCYIGILNISKKKKEKKKKEI